MDFYRHFEKSRPDAPGVAAKVPSGDVGHGAQSSKSLEPSNGKYEPTGHDTHVV